TDLAIQGNGFFIVGDGNTRYYTRAGMFGLDEDGWLVAPNGMRVMGWSADTQGNIQVNGPLTGIQIPEGQTIQPRPTTSMALVGNLDVRTTGTLSFTPITVDDGANTAQVNITIQPAGGFNEFRWT